MEIKKYEEVGDRELDIIREVASIGTGYAATSLAGLLGEKVHMSIPQIGIKGYDETVDYLGDPEEAVAAVLSQMSGDMDGLILFLLRMDFVNTVLSRLLGKTVAGYDELGEMEMSALGESGNILISSYMNALSALSGMKIELSVPSVSVNMLGGIMSVPMAEFGYETDKLMLLDGQLLVGEQKIDSALLMMPDIVSLNRLMKKLGAVYDEGN